MKIVTLKGKDIVTKDIGARKSGKVKESPSSAHGTRIPSAEKLSVEESSLSKQEISRSVSNHQSGVRAKSKKRRDTHQLSPEARIEHKAIGLLARREHSELELRNKLKNSDFEAHHINAVIARLVEQGLQSDERFSEAYVRMRRNRGFGPVKIRVELKAKGIADMIIEEYLEFTSPDWIDIACLEYKKKYGDDPISDYNQWTKRARFMQGRGFTNEHIRVALPDAEFY